jgi:hypothetical protein
MPVIANGFSAPPPAAPGVVQTPVQLPAPQSSLLAAQAMVNALYAARLKLASGQLASITIDGEQTVFRNAKDLETSIQFWERKVAILNRTRRRISTLWMGSRR